MTTYRLYRGKLWGAYRLLRLPSFGYRPEYYSHEHKRWIRVGHYFRIDTTTYQLIGNNVRFK